MRRVLALALLVVALLLSGCARHPLAAAPAGSDRPAATESPAPAGTSQTAGTQQAAATQQTAGTRQTTGTNDVGSLLDDVDKQLNSDDQTPADQD